MPIVKWGTPPSGNHNERKASVVGHGEGVSLLHAVSGERVGGGGEVDTTNPNFGRAILSTAPYKGPEVGERPSEPPNPWGYRSPKRAKKCMGNGDTCMAWATKKYDGQYCNAHGRQADGLPAWPSNERPAVEVDDLFEDD